MRKGIQFLN